jgi:hypothetical protein
MRTVDVLVYPLLALLEGCPHETEGPDSGMPDAAVAVDAATPPADAGVKPDGSVAVDSGVDAGGAYTHSSGVIVPPGFPNPTNTGFRALGLTDAMLTDSAKIFYDVGDSGTISSPNVITGIRTRNHDIYIRTGTHDITFRGCDLSNRGDWAVYLQRSVSRIRFEYCDIHGEDKNDDRAINASSTRLQAAIWSAGADTWTVDHGNIYWLADGPYTIGNDVTVTNTYFHDFTYWSGAFFAPNGDHTNALGPDGGGSKRHRYEHNTFLMVRWNGTVFDQTSAINLAQDDPTGYDDMVINDNFFVGNQGGHMILGYEPGKGGAVGKNIKVTNNRHSNFGTSSPPRAGYHGQPTWNQAPANNVWMNNVWVGADSVTPRGTVGPVGP